MAAKVLIDAEQCRRTIARIAHEIVEHHPDPSAIALVGLHTRGVPLADRLRALITEFSGATPAIGSVDIALYRDDVGVGGGRRGVVPVVGETVLDFDIGKHTVILVDDVLFTGRTIRAAINELFDYGRPARIRLATLVDRGGRELPISADFSGADVNVAPGESVELTRDAQGRLALKLTRD